MDDTLRSADKARREKLGALPYDLIPYQELTEAYARVAEFGAKKYTQYWDNECQGLLNVPGVSWISLTLPRECVRAAMHALGHRKSELFPEPSARFVESLDLQKSKEPVSVVLAMRQDSNEITLSITNGKKTTLESIIEKTQPTGWISKNNDLLIQFLENVTSGLSFSHISDQWGSRRQNTSSIETEGVQYVEPLLIFTLITTTHQVVSEGFFARSATTVSDFWATISKVLQGHSLIYAAEILVKKTGCWNWSLGLPRVQLLGSLLRHTFAYLRGENRDKDSGLSHTDHILWNAVTLCHNVRWNLEDGRRPEPYRGYKDDLPTPQSASDASRGNPCLDLSRLSPDLHPATTLPTYSA